MNAADEFLAYIGPYLLGRSALLLAYAAGVVYAVMYWRTHRAVAVLVAGGCATLATTALTFPVIQWYMIRQNLAGGGNPQDVRLWVNALGFVSGLTTAAGTGLLLAAAFVSRRRHVTYPPG